jgi:hypothetical protein
MRKHRKLYEQCEELRLNNQDKKIVNSKFTNLVDTGLMDSIITKKVDITEFDVINTLNLINVDTTQHQDTSTIKNSVLDASLYSQFRVLSKGITSGLEAGCIQTETCEKIKKESEKDKNEKAEKKTKLVLNKLNIDDLVKTIKSKYNKLLMFNGSKHNSRKPSTNTSKNKKEVIPSNIKTHSKNNLVGLVINNNVINYYCQTEPDEFNELQFGQSKKKRNEINLKQNAKPTLDSIGSTNGSNLNNGLNANNSNSQKQKSENNIIQQKTASEITDRSSKEGKFNSELLCNMALTNVNSLEFTDSSLRNNYKINNVIKDSKPKPSTFDNKNSIKSLYYQKETTGRNRNMSNDANNSRSRSNDMLSLYLNKKKIDNSLSRQDSTSSRRIKPLIHELKRNVYSAPGSNNPVSISPSKERKKENNYYNVNYKPVYTQNCSISKNVSTQSNKYNSVNLAYNASKGGVLRKPKFDVQPTQISMKRYNIDNEVTQRGSSKSDLSKEKRKVFK